MSAMTVRRKRPAVHAVLESLEQRLFLTAAVSPDTTPPSAQLNVDSLALIPGGFSFTITYSDDVAVRYASLRGQTSIDTPVAVVGAGGKIVIPRSFTPDSDSAAITVRYETMPLCGGWWDFTCSGTYTVSIRSDQITDTSGNSLAPGPLGTLDVQVPPPVIPADGIIRHEGMADTIMVSAADDVLTIRELCVVHHYPLADVRGLVIDGSGAVTVSSSSHRSHCPAPSWAAQATTRSKVAALTTPSLAKAAMTCSTAAPQRTV